MGGIVLGDYATLKTTSKPLLCLPSSTFSPFLRKGLPPMHAVAQVGGEEIWGENILPWRVADGGVLSALVESLAEFGKFYPAAVKGSRRFLPPKRPAPDPSSPS